MSKDISFKVLPVKRFCSISLSNTCPGPTIGCLSSSIVKNWVVSHTQALNLKHCLWALEIRNTHIYYQKQQRYQAFILQQDINITEFVVILQCQKCGSQFHHKMVHRRLLPSCGNTLLHGSVLRFHHQMELNSNLSSVVSYFRG